MKCISKALVGGFYALFLFVPAASDARGLPSRASVDIEAEMAFDALLSRVAQQTLDQYRMKAGSQAPDQAVARFDVSTGSVTVELRGWLPETGGAELEDLQGQLMNEVLDQARLVYPASGIEFRYNGESFEEHYPEEAAAELTKGLQPSCRASHAADGTSERRCRKRVSGMGKGQGTVMGSRAPEGSSMQFPGSIKSQAQCCPQLCVSAAPPTGAGSKLA